MHQSPNEIDAKIFKQSTSLGYRISFDDPGKCYYYDYEAHDDVIAAGVLWKVHRRTCFVFFIFFRAVQ